jgi:tricorn protease
VSYSGDVRGQLSFSKEITPAWSECCDQRIAGGAAERLTFHSDVVDEAPLRWGPDNMVVTWTPDSKNIVFLSRRNTFNSWFGRYFAVAISGGLPTELPLDRGGMLSYSPDGQKIVYNRIFRNFRTWKRYDGGLAQQLYLYDFPSKQLTEIAPFQGTSTDPMWYGNTIFSVGSGHKPPGQPLGLRSEYQSRSPNHQIH